MVACSIKEEFEMANGLQPPIPEGAAWQFSFFDLSVPDISVIVFMIVVFGLAIIIPFPGGKEKK
jgi:hypothetical protein